jgi:hypothetical protein
VAAWYFIVFITLSVMVLQSLFVGIIISAMELLKDGVSQEADMWRVIYQRADKYGLQNSTLVNLLDIFNALDTQLHGLLTVTTTPRSPSLTLPPQETELEPLLRFLPPIPNLVSLISQVPSPLVSTLTPPPLSGGLQGQGPSKLRGVHRPRAPHRPSHPDLQARPLFLTPRHHCQSDPLVLLPPQSKRVTSLPTLRHGDETESASLPGLPPS